MFQGWKVLGATVFTQALQAGLLIYAFGVIILPFQSEFDASRQSLMFATVLLSLVTNIISPFVGVRVDQAGVRRLMMLGAALLAMGFVALSLVTALWQVLAIFALLMPAANLMLGQLTASALMTRWFSRRRGRALGLSAIGTSIGGFCLPPLLAALSAVLGWRTAYLGTGLAIALIAIPVIRLFVIDRPEEIGQHPDGDPAAAETGSSENMKSRWTTGSILRTPMFWQIGIVIGIVLAVYMSMLSNLVPHATDQGIAPTRAALLISLLAVLAIGGKLGFGVLADKIDLRLALWAVMGLMAAGFLIMLASSSFTGIATACLPLGLAAGGILPIWGAMVARGFGAADYGRALGLINPVMMPFTFTAPPATGWVFDNLGNYDWAFRGFLVALLVAALILASLKLPAREGNAS